LGRDDAAGAHKRGGSASVVAGLFVVVQLQRDLTTARLNELTALVQQALAQLALDEGRTLERDKLELQIK
jgi:hypothetical protein